MRSHVVWPYHHLRTVLADLVTRLGPEGGNARKLLYLDPQPGFSKAPSPQSAASLQALQRALVSQVDLNKQALSPASHRSVWASVGSCMRRSVQVCLRAGGRLCSKHVSLVYILDDVHDSTYSTYVHEMF